MYNSFNGLDDVMDSRDILVRIEELTDEFTEATEGDPADVMSVDDWAFGLSWDDAVELHELIEFVDKYDGQYGDSFRDGVVFYHEDYFTDAMKSMLGDIGVLPNDVPGWLVIDWEATADNLRADYTEATFRGNEYWAR